MTTAGTLRQDPAERRRLGPRAAVDLEITLARDRGNPVLGQVMDLGSGGMRVATRRPLGVDELLRFELDVGAAETVAGKARVLREHARTTYALRFEALPGPAQDSLAEFLTTALQ